MALGKNRLSIQGGWDKSVNGGSKMEMEEEILLRYAYACATKFFSWATQVGVAHDDVKGEAAVAVSEFILRKKEAIEYPRAYLATMINTRCQKFLANNSQSTGLGKNYRMRGLLWKAACEMGKEIDKFNSSDITTAANLLGVSEDIFHAVWNRRVMKDIPLDAPSFADSDSRTIGDMFRLPKEEIDGRAYRMTPEELLLKKEEKINSFRKSPEEERKLLYSWIEFLPKNYEQILRHRYLYPSRQYGVRSFSSVCDKRHGGKSPKGLAMSPSKASEVESEAIEMLRQFARGNFSGADFTRVVERVPRPLIERFVEDVSDDATKMALRYRLLTKYSVEHKNKGGSTKYTSSGVRGSLKVVARGWRKRLSRQLGCDLTKQEAEEEIVRRFGEACRELALQAGIASPSWKVKNK